MKASTKPAGPVFSSPVTNFNSVYVKSKACRLKQGSSIDFGILQKNKVPQNFEQKRFSLKKNYPTDIKNSNYQIGLFVSSLWFLDVKAGDI